MTTDERLDRIDASIARLMQYVLDFREETATRLKVIESRLDVQAATLNSIEARLPALTKAIFESGALSSQLVIEQSKQKASAADLAARVAKLEEAVAKLEKPAA